VVVSPQLASVDRDVVLLGGLWLWLLSVKPAAPENVYYRVVHIEITSQGDGNL